MNSLSLGGDAMSLPADFCLPCGCLGTIDWDENEQPLPNGQSRPCPYCEYGKREAVMAETRRKIDEQLSSYLFTQRIGLEEAKEKWPDARQVKP